MSGSMTNGNNMLAGCNMQELDSNALLDAFVKAQVDNAKKSLDEELSKFMAFSTSASQCQRQCPPGLSLAEVPKAPPPVPMAEPMKIQFSHSRTSTATTEIAPMVSESDSECDSHSQVSVSSRQLSEERALTPKLGTEPFDMAEVGMETYYGRQAAADFDLFLKTSQHSWPRYISPFPADQPTYVNLSLARVPYM
eukprot:TRINITY_DN65827_c0_g1_i1.p1 TRINITY_DN65827_c0_g1~~TRINITY_DN65827_c0_g1_i1.p1  ORF type:complete len:216 (+),score=38.87 TRINITY_DN65827_c0_g1_i1:64-648(+)